MSADQVSWRALEADAQVIGSDGGEIGRVDEIVGDLEEDMFVGLSVKVDGFDDPRFVDADSVVAIWPDRVSVSLPATAAASLPAHTETRETDWDPVEEKEEADEGFVESLIGDVTEPGDQLEIGRSPMRAAFWAVLWGAVTTGVFALLPVVDLAGGVYFGLLAGALVLVMGIWSQRTDALIGLGVGAVAAVFLYVNDSDALVSVAAGLVILVASVAMGQFMRARVQRSR